MSKVKTKKTTGATTPASAATQPVSGRVPDSRILLIGVLILTFAVFANTLTAGFVNWDDHGYLWLNALVQPLSGKAIADMFSSHTCGNYSPLVVFTYCIEHGFDNIVKPGQQVVENFQPFKYHLSNVLLHLGATSMAFLLFKSLGLRGWALAFATALFGVHPLRSESVAWVTERKDVLYGLFYIAALYTWQQYLTKPEQKTKFYALTLLLGVLSLFSKIQAVSLPLSMLTLDYLAGRNLRDFKIWLEKAPFFGLSLIFGLVGLHYLNIAEGLKDAGYPLSERLFFATYSLCHYLFKMVFPVGLSAYYPYPDIGAMPAIYYVTPLVLIGLAWAVWRSAKQNKIVVFGALFFLVNIMFVLQFKGAGKAFLADRFTYIPYIGLFFILAKYLQDVMDGHIKTGLKSVLPVAAAVFTGVCAFLCFQQNQTWHSSITLWENVTEKHPKDGLSWTNLGLAHFDTGNLEASLKAYQQALSVNPQYHDAAYNTAVSLHQLKRYPEAIQAFTQALNIKPDNADTYLSRGKEYAAAKDYPKALADYEKAKTLGLKIPAHELNYLMGIANAGMNQHQAAVSLFDAAIREAPGESDYYYQKGNSLAAMGDMASAIVQYDAAVKQNPQHADALNNKGNALATLSKFEEALAAFNQALALKPDMANTYLNRGMVRNSLNDRANACADWQKAAQMGHPQAQAILADLCK